MQMVLYSFAGYVFCRTGARKPLQDPALSTSLGRPSEKVPTTPGYIPEQQVRVTTPKKKVPTKYSKSRVTLQASTFNHDYHDLQGRLPPSVP